LATGNETKEEKGEKDDNEKFDMHLNVFGEIVPEEKIAKMDMGFKPNPSVSSDILEGSLKMPMLGDGDGRSATAVDTNGARDGSKPAMSG